MTTNVGDWHWLQRDVSKWACSFLTANLPCPDLAVERVEEVQGDVTICQRKGKLLCVYDVSLTLCLPDAVKMQFQDILSDFDAVEDLSFKIAPLGSVIAGKDAICKHLLQVFSQMVAAAFEINGKELVSSKAAAAEAPVKETFKETPVVKPAAVLPLPCSASTSFGTGTWSNDFSFEISLANVWNALLDCSLIKKWSGCDECLVDCRLNGGYSIFNGNIVGHFCKPPVHHQQLVLQWRISSWPAEHYSTLSLRFSSAGPNECVVSLKQEYIPSAELASTQHYWNDYIWQRIKMLFGQGGIF